MIVTREDKFMEWIERLNETIDYIEEHLTEEIDYEELAKIAGCSTYHFQRMFAFYGRCFIVRIYPAAEIVFGCG